ncbi:hypothetical protein OWR21_12530 [Ralstonia sp. 1B3]
MLLLDQDAQHAPFKRGQGTDGATLRSVGLDIHDGTAADTLWVGANSNADIISAARRQAALPAQQQAKLSPWQDRAPATPAWLPGG